MKTLLYCTAWGDTQDALERRLGRWVRHHEALAYPCPVTLAAIGDGIPSYIQWPLGNYRQINLEPHLGRLAHLHYPGWWRSYTHGLEVAKALNCERLWHVESDFFLASKKIINCLDSITSGWEAMWCPRHNFAETAVQVICVDRFSAFEQIATRWAVYAGQHAESVLPFDRINRDMVGDRYGEAGVRPEEVSGLDFYGQLPDNEPTWFEPNLTGVTSHD